MSSREAPEPWATRMIERGFVDGRSGKRAGIAALARKCGLHTTTVSDALNGSTETSALTKRLIVEQLGSDTASWFGHERLDQWVPPDNAALLTERQRRALEELINSMTERQEPADAAPTKEAGQAGAKITKLPTPPTMEDIEAGRAAAHRTRKHRRDTNGDRQT